MSEKLRKRVVKASLALAIVLAATALFAGGVQAAPIHRFLGSLDGADAPTGEFSGACGDFVDSEGNLYVVNYGTSSIDIYSPSQQYITSIGDPNGPCSGAVDSEGNVFVWNFSNSGTGFVVQYSPDSYPPTASTQYGAPTNVNSDGDPRAVAVNPANDHVFINMQNRIVEYKPSREGLGVINSKIGEGKIEGSWGLEVYGATGDIYAMDHLPDGKDKVKIFNSAGAEVSSFNGSTSPNGAFTNLILGYLAVDQASGNVYIDQIQASGVIEEFEPDGTYVSQLGAAQGFRSAEPSDIAVDNSGGPNDGDIYVTSGAQSSIVFQFGPLTEVFPLTVAKAGTGAGTVTSSPAGISCGGECTAEFEEGAEVTLAPTPGTGSAFSGWAGACTGAGACKVQMSEAKLVTATFNQAFLLTVAKTGTGSGTVTSSPAGIDCGSVCKAELEEGKEVTFSASAAPGSKFSEWSGACTGAAACKVTMSEAKSVSARFEAEVIPPPAQGSSQPGKPAPTCATDASLCPPGTPSVGGTAKVKNGKAALQLHCSGTGACAGKLKLTAKITSGKGKSKQTKTLTIATSAFSVLAGDSTTLEVRLSGPANNILKSGKALKATVAGDGLRPTAVKLTIAVAKKGRR